MKITGHDYFIAFAVLKYAQEVGSVEVALAELRDIRDSSILTEAQFMNEITSAINQSGGFHYPAEESRYRLSRILMQAISNPRLIEKLLIQGVKIRPHQLVNVGLTISLPEPQ